MYGPVSRSNGTEVIRDLALLRDINFPLCIYMLTGGILRSKGRTKELRESPDVVSSNAKRVLDSIVVEGVDEDVVKRVKVSFC